MTPPIQHRVLIDTGYTGTFARAIDDISAFVINQISWNAGMQQPYDEVANPARLTLTLSNADGSFSRETLGHELLANGDFSAWTADNPDGWAVSGESGTDPQVSQVSNDGVHGGSGTGAANLYSTSAVLTLSQNGILSAGETYALTFTITSLTDSVGGIAFYNGSTQVTPLYHNLGTYTVVFNATSDQFNVQTYGACDVTLDNISVKQTALYAMIQKGMLIRLNAIYNGTTYTHFTAHITELAYTLGLNNLPIVTVTAEDPMLRLLDKEYLPVAFASAQTTVYDRGIAIFTYLTSYTLVDALNRIFDDAIISWPYARGNWILGAQGSSELGLTTYLFSHSLTYFYTPADYFSFIGDLGDRGNGINVQSYIRDLVAMEAGGRFYFNPRTSKFDFIARKYDPVITSTVLTLNDSDLDSVNFVYGKDLVNKLTVHFTNREIGGAGTVIWSANNLPFVLRADHRARNINAPYFDPTNSARRIAAKDFIVPYPGTDYIANVNPDGSGEIATGSVSISADMKANGAKIIMSNSGNTDIYVTTLQLRGTPMYTTDDTVESVNADSVREFDEFPRTIEVRMFDDSTFAQNYADYLTGKFKSPLNRVESLTFSSLRSPTLTAAAASLIQNTIDTLNAHITVNLPQYGHSAVNYRRYPGKSRRTQEQGARSRQRF